MFRMNCIFVQMKLIIFQLNNYNYSWNKLEVIILFWIRSREAVKLRIGKCLEYIYYRIPILSRSLFLQKLKYNYWQSSIIHSQVFLGLKPKTEWQLFNQSFQSVFHAYCDNWAELKLTDISTVSTHASRRGKLFSSINQTSVWFELEMHQTGVT